MIMKKTSIIKLQMVQYLTLSALSTNKISNRNKGMKIRMLLSVQFAVASVAIALTKCVNRILVRAAGGKNK